MTKYSYVPKVIEFGEARRKIETSVNNGQEKKAANSLRRFEHSLPIGNGMLGYFQ
ncbi:MAG: hypothetical protein LBD18_06020 [Treponema sp.]|jgi:hypothetical protein|nr:hypothetical protein [Treponema sp.]